MRRWKLGELVGVVEVVGGLGTIACLVGVWFVVAAVFGG